VFDLTLLDGKPWRGEYVDQWRCQGEKPYRNDKGNRAKCPYSHKGAWFDAPAPSRCGKCGSQTETVSKWIPFDNHKNRLNLFRLVYAYTEEANVSPLTPLLVGGKPAVEMHFELPIPGISTSEGESFTAVGHLDSVKQETETSGFITDLKTTKKTLGDGYFRQFSPNVQIEWYDTFGKFVIPGFEVQGILIEAAQLFVDGVRLELQPVFVNEGVTEENLKTLPYWLGQAEAFAKAEFWPQNKSNCAICPFRSVCTANPRERQEILEEHFERVYWNPTKERV
jgi:hypothetical protein